MTPVRMIFSTSAREPKVHGSLPPRPAWTLSSLPMRVPGLDDGRHKQSRCQLGGAVTRRNGRSGLASKRLGRPSSRKDSI